MRSNNLIFLTGLLLTIFTNGCRKNNNLMPYVPVDIYINTSLPAYSYLNSIGGWVYVTGGNDGIIIYRQSYETIVAYERRCTFNVQESCGYGVVDSSWTTVDCVCDGTKYLIYDGSVLEGPATFGLYQYRVAFNPDNNEVHVYN